MTFIGTIFLTSAVNRHDGLEAREWANITGFFRTKKTKNQGKNEFQQISVRVKVIIQTLDDTYHGWTADVLRYVLSPINDSQQLKRQIIHQTARIFKIN